VRQKVKICLNLSQLHTKDCTFFSGHGVHNPFLIIFSVSNWEKRMQIMREFVHLTTGRYY